MELTPKQHPNTVAYSGFCRIVGTPILYLPPGYLDVLSCVSVDREGTGAVGQDWRYLLSPSQDGGGGGYSPPPPTLPSSDRSTPCPLDRIGQELLSAQLPHLSPTHKAGVPPGQDRRTIYIAGSTSLAVTQEDFLVENFNKEPNLTETIELTITQIKISVVSSCHFNCDKILQRNKIRWKSRVRWWFCPCAWTLMWSRHWINSLLWIPNRVLGIVCLWGRCLKR